MPEILHGTWLPAVRRFFLWGESGTRTRARRTAGPAMHPFSLDAERIRQLTHEAGISTGDLTTETIWLPAVGGFPLPSPELSATGTQEPVHGTPTLSDFRLPGRTLAILPAVDFLLALPPTVDWGADLRAWRFAALLALEIVAHQAILPVIEINEAKLLARWRPLPGPTIRAKLDAVTRALPPVARAVAVRAEEALPARTLLATFLGAAVDALVRHAATGTVRPELASPGAEWFSALIAPRAAAIRLTGNRGEALQENWRRWAAPAEAGGNEAFQITFRLEPPDGARHPWRLAYLLQATGDPSLLLPAAELWQAGSDAAWLLERVDLPQERFLTGLGYAARLVPAIAASLHQRAPDHAELTVDEAFTFLRETAALLADGGFGVLLPGWWSGRGTRLTMRARARGRSSTVSAHGVLGFDALVDFDWEVTLAGERLDPEEFARLAALKQPLVRVRGQWVALDPETIAAGLRLLEHGTATLTLADALRLGLDPEGSASGIQLAGLEPEGWLRDLLDRLHGEGNLADGETLPAGLCAELRPYQQRGYDWLSFLCRYGLGACLADDMGLGKTLQTITLLLRHKNEEHQPALVICPTSVIGNWQREIQRFAPPLRVLAHRGADRHQDERFAAAANRHDVVITSYPLLTRDAETLRTVHWSAVVLDEAQNIKNPATRQAQAARALDTDRRIALTGTPVENRLGDLWSIMAFLNPGYLGSEEAFRREFANPIERTGDPAAVERLRRLTGPFILRRLKTDPAIIADLPEKFEAKVFCPLTREQATLYEAIVRDALEQLEEESSTGIQRRGQVLAMLTRLKQVTNHPALFLQDGSSLAGRSGKLSRLQEMLEETVAEGDRALIFTQFATMGTMLQQHLTRVLARDVLFLHGGTPATARERMIQRFQAPNGPPVFILSLKAGGTGLNLTAANQVYHFDRWWNPAVENQATDRAFRIGQTKNVQVYKFLCTGTLEERIDALIESKRALAENVLGAGERWLTELSTAELRQLVALRRDEIEENV